MKLVMNGGDPLDFDVLELWIHSPMNELLKASSVVLGYVHQLWKMLHGM